MSLISRTVEVSTRVLVTRLGKFHLKSELAAETDKRGIQAAGATRFSTLSINAKSVSRCWAAMQSCYELGKLKFTGKGFKKVENCLKVSADMFAFRTELHHVTSILSPIERGLRTLEGQNTTLSDVLSIFIGIAIPFGHVFQDPKSSIYQYRDESYGAFNGRFDKPLNRSTTDMFWLGFLLDPAMNLLFADSLLTNFEVYYRDGDLCLNLPPSESFTKESVSPFTLKLIISAWRMLSHEQQHVKSAGLAEADQLVKELKAYMYQEAPFNQPCSGLETCLIWWKARLDDNCSSVLAILGIKLFSVSPSEMCDERTSSQTSAMSTIMA
ncbi:hypothetical protein C8J56DRAFT_1049873 [Mycena floridula]|nr:hypothetical protein C8J56DRAFT_1049873 [Mycena floridula]